jgi:ribosomal protein S8
MNESHLHERRTKRRMGVDQWRSHVDLVDNTGRLVSRVLHGRVNEGYLAGWKRRKGHKGYYFRVYLRDTHGEPGRKDLICLQSISRGMTSRRTYELWFDNAVHPRYTRFLSTSKGVMSAAKARKLGRGGLPLLRVR